MKKRDEFKTELNYIKLYGVDVRYEVMDIDGRELYIINRPDELAYLPFLNREMFEFVIKMVSSLLEFCYDEVLEDEKAETYKCGVEQILEKVRKLNELQKIMMEIQ
ncbi:MAG: hypothetical protein ACLFQV_07620 [Vulcanimicrobiota bacterium]